VPVSLLIALLQVLVLHATSIFGLQTGGVSSGPAAFVALVIGTSLTLLGLGLVQAATARALVELDRGANVSALGAYRLALDSVVPLFGALLAAVLAVSLLASTFYLLPIAIWLAGRWALVRRSIAESGVLTIAGGAAGLALAWLGIRALRPLIPPTVPRADGIGLDGAVLAFTVAMAIGAGICDGLALGLNARAALITRGLAEITRLGMRLGGRIETFMGLAGVGDLVLTCTGELSRNRRVGLRLAHGAGPASILAELGHVAEGVYSAREVMRLAEKLAVDMPITRAVCGVLDGALAPAAAVTALLERDLRAEF